MDVKLKKKKKVFHKKIQVLWFRALPRVIFKWLLPRVKSQVAELPEKFMGTCQERMQTRQTTEQGNWMELTNGTWGRVRSET